MNRAFTLRGSYVRRHYPDFVYRNPVPAHLDMWQLDPERVYYDREYPRSTNPPGMETHHYRELAHCRLDAQPGNGALFVTVTLLPNEYTVAKEERRIFEVFLPEGMPFSDSIINWILRTAILHKDQMA